MKTSMASPEMSKYADAKRQLSSRIMSMEIPKKSAGTIRSKFSILHGLSHTSDDDDDDGTEIGGTTSRLISAIQGTPRKYFCNESACVPSSSPNGVKRSERIATRHQLKVIDRFFCKKNYHFLFQLLLFMLLSKAPPQFILCICVSQKICERMPNLNFCTIGHCLLLCADTFLNWGIWNAIEYIH